jgi:hypothetical protein
VQRAEVAADGPEAPGRFFLGEAIAGPGERFLVLVDTKDDTLRAERIEQGAGVAAAAKGGVHVTPVGGGNESRSYVV